MARGTIEHEKQTMVIKTPLLAKDLARLYGVTTWTIYEWVAAGKLKKMDLRGRAVRFRRADFEHLLAQRGE